MTGASHELDFKVKFDTTNDPSTAQIMVITRVIERHIKEALDGFTAVDYNSIKIEVS
jgi:hypothetical protein